MGICRLPPRGKPKQILPRPKLESHSPTGETHNGNLQKGSSNIASPIKERGRKEKTQARTSAIKENSFQTSYTKAQLPKDTKVQRHKSTGTASNSPESSPKNGAKTQQPNVEKHALKRCCSPETKRKERYSTQRCRDPLLRSHRSQKRKKLFKQGAHHPGTGHIHKHLSFIGYYPR